MNNPKTSQLTTKTFAVSTKSTAGNTTTYVGRGYMVKSLRKEQNLSVTQLAKKAGVSRMSIRRIECGELPAANIHSRVHLCVFDELKAEGGIIYLTN